MMPFHPFSGLHAATVAVVLVVIALTVGWAARQTLDRARRIGRGLAGLLVVYYVVESALRVGWLGVDPALIWPIDICSALFFIGAGALWWNHRQAFAIVSLWTFACTLHSLITPTPGAGFPSLEYVRYFTTHGLLVFVAVYVLIALAERPTFREAVVAMLALQGWAAFAGVIDWVTGYNFLYLRYPPPSPTLIDALGPWPWYILGLEGVCVASFALWYAAFTLLGRVPLGRRRRRSLSPARSAVPFPSSSA